MGVAVDLCTGAGPIAAVLGAAVPTARVLATELDPEAVRCARRNGVDVLEGFLDDPLPVEFERRVDVMTAVVLYVPTGSLRLLPRADVQAFEPWRVLETGGPKAPTRSTRSCTEVGAGCGRVARSCSSWVVTKPNRWGGCSVGSGSGTSTSWSTKTVMRAPSPPSG